MLFTPQAVPVTVRVLQLKSRPVKPGVLFQSSTVQFWRACQNWSLTLADSSGLLLLWPIRDGILESLLVTRAGVTVPFRSRHTSLPILFWSLISTRHGRAVMRLADWLFVLHTIEHVDPVM